MTQVPDGTLVTYQGNWRTSTFKTADGIVNQVSADLNGAGLIVRSFNVNASWLANLSGVAKEDFDVTLHIQVENGLGFGSTDDIVSIIRHWVLDKTGAYPNTDSVPYIMPPGSTTQMATGQPSASSGNAGCTAGTSNDTAGNFSFSCWFTNLTTKGLTSVGFLTLLAALGIGLFIYAKPGVASGAARRALG